jgi:16S rRNA processing protein RimM
MASPRRTTSREQQELSSPVPQRSGDGASAPSYATPVTQPGSLTNPGAISAPRWVLLARLIRPHGRHGEIVAEILTDFPERFHERPRLFLIPPERLGTRPREVRLQNFWFQRSRIVLKLEAVNSINDAEALRGFSVAIPATERAPLDSGEVYVSDLIGCRVVDLNAGAVEAGEIIDVDRGSSSTDLLVLRRRGMRSPDNEILIPFVKEYLVRIDIEGRRIEMRLPEGLLAINQPMTEEEKSQMKGGGV